MVHYVVYNLVLEIEDPVIVFTPLFLPPDQGIRDRRQCTQHRLLPPCRGRGPLSGITTRPPAAAAAGASPPPQPPPTPFRFWPRRMCQRDGGSSSSRSTTDSKTLDSMKSITTKVPLLNCSVNDLPSIL